MFNSGRLMAEEEERVGESKCCLLYFDLQKLPNLSDWRFNNEKWVIIARTQHRAHRCVELSVTNWFTLKVLPTSTNMSDTLNLPTHVCICNQLQNINIGKTNTCWFFFYFFLFFSTSNTVFHIYSWRSDQATFFLPSKNWLI